MKKINVGVVGLGNIGGGVALSLLNRKGLLAKKTGIQLNLAKAFDTRKAVVRKLKIPKNAIARSVNEILNDKKIDVIVELIGGIHPAKEIIEQAFLNGKHVVTANKALLAEHGPALFKKAKKAGRYIGFEASVCGAIPVVKAVGESFAANNISAVYGIVNGTCNYILDKMFECRVPQAEALKEAQAKGIAEANPKLDVDGHDASHKLAILAKLAFGVAVKPRAIYVEGIRGVDLQDMIYARVWGFDIKLLAIAKLKGAALELRVHPTLIPVKHLLSAVRKEDNAVFIKGDMIGESMLYGKGAGRFPTASAVISDIVDVNRPGGFEISRLDETRAISIKKMDDLVSRYYLRFQVIDAPGVLSRISTILARNRISIADVTQTERREMQVVPLVMLSHDAKESSMKKALREIQNLNVVKGKPVMIRIEK